MHGMCPKCVEMTKPACGCPSAMSGPAMPEVLAMPMMQSPPPAPMSDEDKGKMREAAKELLAKLQDLDFDNVEMFDLKVVMSGDAEEMDSLMDVAPAVETSDKESEKTEESDDNTVMLDDK